MTIRAVTSFAKVIEMQPAARTKQQNTKAKRGNNRSVTQNCITGISRLAPGFEGKRELSVETVESPYFKGEYEPAIKNIRESSLATMHARGQIDDAQLRAGEWFRHAYEAMRLGSMAVDPSREPVDTSGIADPILDRVIDASKKLSAAAAVLGKIAFPVVVMVCGEGRSISETAQRYFAGSASHFEMKYIGKLFRDALDELAAWRGYASPRNGRPGS